MREKAKRTTQNLMRFFMDRIKFQSIRFKKCSSQRKCSPRQNIMRGGPYFQPSSFFSQTQNLIPYLISKPNSPLTSFLHPPMLPLPFLLPPQRISRRHPPFPSPAISILYFFRISLSKNQPDFGRVRCSSKACRFRLLFVENSRFFHLLSFENSPSLKLRAAHKITILFIIVVHQKQ